MYFKYTAGQNYRIFFLNKMCVTRVPCNIVTIFVLMKGESISFQIKKNMSKIPCWENFIIPVWTPERDDSFNFFNMNPSN